MMLFNLIVFVREDLVISRAELLRAGGRYIQRKRAVPSTGSLPQWPGQGWAKARSPELPRGNFQSRVLPLLSEFLNYTWLGFAQVFHLTLFWPVPLVAVHGHSCTGLLGGQLLVAWELTDSQVRASPWPSQAPSPGIQASS